MKIRHWILGSAAVAVLLAAGAGSSMAGFTAQAEYEGNAQSATLASLFPLELNPIHITAAAKGSKGTDAAPLGTLVDQPGGHVPTVTFDGPSGLSLSSTSEPLTPGGVDGLTLDGLASLNPGQYTVTVTVSLGGFTESASTQVTVAPPPSPSPSPSQSGMQPHTSPSNNVPPSSSDSGGQSPVSGN